MSELQRVLENYAEEEIRSDRPRRYMSTTAKLSRDSARMDATTRTWTRQPVIGFTGGVMVVFVGDDEQTIGRTDVHSFGVDGFRVPFKRSDRTDRWWEPVDPAIAQAATRFEIFHAHTPKADQLPFIVDQAVAVATPIAKLVALIRGLSG